MSAHASGVVGHEGARPDAGVRVLVAEDDADLRDVLVSSLRLAGIEAAAAGNGLDALRLHRELSPQLLLLDVAMPGMTGFEVVTDLRRRGDATPVIFLTARDELRDKLTGFQSGGDDYLTKPFSLAELIARIRAVLARATSAPPALLAYGDLQLDEAGHRVRKAGRAVELTPTEFRLLAYLMENAERVLSRQQILTEVWGYDYGGNASVVENYVSFLRRKVDGGDPKLIHTIRGVGYTIRDDSTA